MFPDFLKKLYQLKLLDYNFQYLNKNAILMGLKLLI